MQTFDAVRTTAEPTRLHQRGPSRRAGEPECVGPTAVLRGCTAGPST